MSIADGTILSQRQLNRTLLARQYLLQRTAMPVSEMVSHLAGMQSQVPTDPYTGLWTRLRDFDHDTLSTLMLDRDAVRASMMRGTIHLVTRDDYVQFQPAMMPFHDRAIRHIASTRDIPADVVPAILAAGTEALRSTPMSVKALGMALAGRFPDYQPRSLAQTCRFGLPLVQATPRGIWGANHQPTWALASEWLDTSIPDDTAPNAMLRRYLAAFGPATVADMQAWSGLTGLRSVMQDLRSELRVFRNERGQELFDVPDALILGDDAPAPVRFLPEFDNALLSHKDRSRIISDERRKAIGSINGRFSCTYLVDGFVAGTWKIDKYQDDATLVLTPFEEHSSEVVRELEEEGRNLLRFHNNANQHSVTFTPLRIAVDTEGGH